ncbi:NADH dehydrogenase [Ruegeria halocynthiae]|uniref:NADH dehydrogenase n=1 Tax=Ruegeria halocynthiae TaxID=985054 RepID=A0A1H2YH87_9RHOB|nr:NAD(P)/FAD-dependent oxidoreductase [Ruegeria halocynthiae]SDX04168.1 NADH dehydrogenase [Ruegeria halocynthiae]
MRPETKPHIVIVGGGAGGLNLATRLSRSLGRRGLAEVTLVDENLTHMWKPSLHEFASGTKGNEDEISFLEHSNRNGYNFRLGRLSALDSEAKTILLDPVRDSAQKLLAPQRILHFDYLVMAIGSRSNDFGCKGVSEHCMFLDTPKQAKKMQAELLNLCLRLETGALGDGVSKLNICIIGGGATGVELAAELREATEQFARNGIDKLRDPSSVNITLIEAADRLVAALPDQVSEKVAQKLRSIDVDLRLSSMVEEATADGVRLKGGDMIPAELMIWAAGIKAPAILKDLNTFDIGSLGRLCTKPTLQTTKSDPVFAIGDCAECLWPEKGTSLPPRAQVASQQAEFMEAQLRRAIEGKPLEEFRYVDRGSLVAISKYSAVGSLMGKALGTMTIEGWLARRAYRYLHYAHESAVQGSWRATVRSLLSQAMKRVRPQLKLH